MDDLRELVETSPEATTAAIEFTDIENLDEAMPLLLQLPNLQELSLQGNQLNTLPQDLSALKNLQKLDISSNSFASVADVVPALITLPCLSSLIVSLDSDNDQKMLIAALPGLVELNEKPVHAPTPTRSLKHSRAVSPQHSHTEAKPPAEKAEEKPVEPPPAATPPPAEKPQEKPKEPEKPQEKVQEKPKEPEKPPILPLELPPLDELPDGTLVDTLLRSVREASLATTDVREEIEAGVTTALQSNPEDKRTAQDGIVELAKRLLVSSAGSEEVRTAVDCVYRLEAAAVQRLKEEFDRREAEMVQKTELETVEARAAALETEGAELKKQLQEATDSAAALRETNASLSSEISKLQESAHSSLSTIDRLQSENTAFEQQLSGISETLARTQQERDSLEAAVASEREAAAALQHTLQDSERKVQSLTVELQEETKVADGHVLTIRTLESQLKMKRALEESSRDEQVRALQEQNANLMSQMKQLLAEKEDLDKSFAEYRRNAEEERGALQAEALKAKAELEAEKNSSAHFSRRFGARSLAPETRSSRFSEAESDMMHRITSQSPSHRPRRPTHRISESLKNGNDKQLSLNQLLHLITAVETSKAKTGSRDTYAEHMQTVLLKTYGLKTFREMDCDVELFRKLTSDEVDEKYVIVHETLKKQIGEQLRSWIKEKNPLKPGREIDRLYQLQIKGQMTVPHAVEIVGKIFSFDDVDTLRLILTEFARSGTRHSPNEMKISYKDVVQTSLRYALQRHVDYLSPLINVFSRLDANRTGRITQLGLDEKRVLSLLRAVDPENLQTVTFSSLVDLLEAETSEGVSFLQRLEQLRSDAVEEEAEGAQPA